MSTEDVEFHEDLCGTEGEKEIDTRAIFSVNKARLFNDLIF